MKRSLPLSALATAALMAMPSLGWADNAAAHDVAEHCPDTIRVADTGIEGMEELTRAFEPFAEAMADAAGIEFEFFAVSDRTAAANALQFDQVDLVLAGPSEYAIIASRQDVEIAWGLERAEYGTRFFVPADSEVEELADLKGGTVALKDVGSTTGHITPAWMLTEAGLDIDRDLDIIMAADNRVQVLLSGDVDALGGGYRDEEIIQRMDPDFDYRIVADSGTMPRDPFIARAGLGSECISALRDVVEANQEELFEAFVAPAELEGAGDEAEERSKYLEAKFVFDTTDEEYDQVREAYAIVGNPLD